MATKNTVGAVLINDSPVVTEATVSATIIDTSLPYMNLVGEWYVNGSKVITEATLPSGGGGTQATLNALIGRSITQIASDATSIGNNAFSFCSQLTTANFTNATSIGNSAFSNCSVLKTANLPNATSVGNYAFQNCSNLATISVPNATSIGNSAFSFCIDQTTANLPNATSVGSSAFEANYSLTKVIMGTNLTTVATLANTNAFNKCYHILGTTNSAFNPTGAKDGYIYVPHSLVADYRSATNWATYATQIMPYVATVGELANINGTTYNKACVGNDYVEYTYNGTSWELYTRS